MTFRAEDKVKYLFLIGLQEEGRVCLIRPPACLTHIYCWLFTASVEPTGHTEKKVPSKQRQALGKMMNKFYDLTVVLHALEM